MKPIVAFITFNRMGSSVKSLKSLLSSPDDFNLYIVDNDSRDKTKEWLESIQDERIVKKIFLPKNYGEINAVNLVLTYRKKGQDFLLIENDVNVLTPNYIKIFQKTLEDFPTLGLIHSKIKYHTENQNWKISKNNSSEIFKTTFVFGAHLYFKGEV